MVSLVRRLRPAAASCVLILFAGCSGAGPADAPTAAPPATPVAAESPTQASETSSEPGMPESPTTTPGATSSAPADPGSSMPSDGALTLSVTDSPLGEILVDGNGMTLYLFTRDSQGADASVCEGECLVNWPPLLGEPTAGEGADDSKLGSFTRADGSVQATYNGWPLYYWVQDSAPGDTTGQGVQGVWFVLDRDGDAVEG